MRWSLEQMPISFRFSHWPLRAKLLALVVAVSLLPLGIATYVDLQRTRAQLLDGMKSLLEARGDQVVQQMEGFHASHQRSVDRLARFPESAAYCAAGQQQRSALQASVAGILAAHPASDPALRDAALLDGSGRIVIATEARLSGLNLSTRPAVRAALQGNAVISDPYVSPGAAGAVPTIAYLAPLRGADGKVFCVAALWVRAAAMWTRVKASDALAGPGSFAVLFDRDGIRIAHTYSDDVIFRPAGRLDPAMVEWMVAERRFGAPTRELLEDVREFPEQFERARAPSPDPAVFRGYAPDNQTWNYGVARRLGSVPWTVFYMVPEAGFVEQIARATRDKMILALGTIAAGCIAGLLFAAGILRPILALNRATAAIAAGDLSARVRDRRRDEFGRLDASFNSMAERIQRQDAELRSARDDLDRQVQERTAELTLTARRLHDEIAERARMQVALQERDAALHRAHVMTKLAHVITGPDGSFQTWSETLPPLMGLAPEQMPQSTREWLRLLHPDDRSTFRSASIAAAVTGTRKDVEYRLRRADGSWIHVRQVIEPIAGQPDADGTTLWFSTLQDVTEQVRAGEELRASEERTRLIVDTALDAVVTMDGGGVITGWSPQAEKTFGWARSEALGRSMAETIVPARFRDAHRRGLEHYIATGDAVVLNRRIELFALHRAGHEFPVELAITPLRIDGAVGFSAFVRDITERRRAEESLRESREMLQGIIDNAPAVIYVKDLEGRYLRVNRRYSELFHLSNEAIVGKTDHEIFPKPAADAFRDMDRRVAAAQQALMEEEEAPHDDGPRTYLSVKCPLWDGAGKPYAVFGISTDITERKRAETKLRSQLSRLELLNRITRAIGERQDLPSIFQAVVRRLEDDMPLDFGCVCVHDPLAGSLVVSSVGSASLALATALGLTPQTQIPIDQNGLSRCVHGELVHEPDVGQVPHPFPQRLAGGGLRALVAAPLVVESDVFGVLIVARRQAHAFSSDDCEFLRQLSQHVGLAAHQAQLHGALQRSYADLRQTQQAVMQQERLRALGQMAGGIAHDINNAISPVALYTEALLERETLSPRARSSLETIQRAIDDVAQTVARMREFYRPREPQLALTAVAMNQLVEQVIDLTRARWSDMPQQRGIVINLVKDLAPELPVVMGVESEIREALTNLVFNATDALPDGGTLTLRTGAAPRPDGQDGPPRAFVEVQDTGVGMDEDTQRRCLEPFFTTKGERGTGLGLAMVYGAAQRHGAELDIESRVGAGTTVRLTFPTTIAPSGQDVRRAGMQAPRVRLRVLIVDDDPILLSSLRDTLEADGHVIEAANGGQSGIDAFCAARDRGQPFAAVITDLGMPHVDGRRVAQAVKEASPDTSVILLTGWGVRLAAEGERPLHVDRVLSKPPRLHELREALASVSPGAE